MPTEPYLPSYILPYSDSHPPYNERFLKVNMLIHVS